MLRMMIPILAAVVLAHGAAAAEPQETPEKAASPSAQPADGPSTLSPAEMAQVSAGDGAQVHVQTQQQLTGASTGNSIEANALTSGAVTFSPEALRGFNGVGNFVINTGMNNTLQGAVNISVVTVPAS